MLESLLKRDRYWVVGGIAAITLLSWAYLFYLAQDMARMEMPIDTPMEMATEAPMEMPMDTATEAPMDMGMSAAMPQTLPWQPREFVFMFAMWAVMMVAMMMPTAAPMILTFAAIHRKRPSPQPFLSHTSAFVLGYLLVWLGFALIATTVQGLLHQAALLSPMMATTSHLLASLLLVMAGIFQWTPLKYTCLRHCRSPFAFLLNDWREGTRGALQMGLKHGSYCLGCCWSLMALLFVAGVMNLLWIATLTALVLVEKVAPGGYWLGRVAGIVFIGWGIWLAVTTLA